MDKRQAYEVVEEVLVLRPALQACSRALGTGIQKDDEVPGRSGDLAKVHPQPWHVPEERRDASRQR